MKTILGVLLALLGGYGLFWWHQVLWASGGPDIGRNTIQYLAPYFVTSVILFVGIYIGAKSFYKLVQR
ncbi:hypothetical protein ACFO3D_17985 [Virgibacillus kekensis]|uniref:Uncharacterized protein n=1 Tax=Virgibacillus kekensis TaxID=202261 RepID=A0ABV9DNQ6_9BACI